MEKKQTKPTTFGILEIDPWLKPYKRDVNMRMKRYESLKKALLKDGETLSSFANGHLFYGFHRTKDGWVYREWAPAADAVYLVGDFNFWNPFADPLTRLPDGSWEIYLPGKDALKHGQRVKARVVRNGVSQDRIPLYINRVKQDPETHDFFGEIWDWDGEGKFRWTDGEWMKGGRKKDTDKLTIYEAHVGMAQEIQRIGTYEEFTKNIIPRIKKAGYNTIQLMAVMEHPYYASFGYHVSNFFAASSWFGNPTELKKLINAAHKAGIRVLMDIVQSHAVPNTREGIIGFDGTDEQFSYAGTKGDHPAWGSKLLNYGKHGVIHFLLSNLKFWVEEYHFDGFRFDGVTSMLYHDHGLGASFDHYDKYFGINTNVEAFNYLQLANELLDELDSNIVTIAEDMSGMPGMCVAVRDGGVGFDYRLSMGVPDFWIKYFKKGSDESLSMWGIWQELTSRRPYERNIGYCESHDQAMVGDKTIIFWLADKEMYHHMSVFSQNLEIDRAIALHKMIRFVSLVLSGEGYLNFMGNEFGHPEWIDFPREGNDWSFHHAQRRWSLADSDHLRYKYLGNFDKDMLKLVKDNSVLGATDLKNLWTDENDKILAFEKGDLVFLFNFNPTTSFDGYELPIDHRGTYRVVFDSDKAKYGGFDRISSRKEYHTEKLTAREGRWGVKIYSPCRTVLVLKKVK